MLATKSTRAGASAAVSVDLLVSELNREASRFFTNRASCSAATVSVRVQLNAPEPPAAGPAGGGSVGDGEIPGACEPPEVEATLLPLGATGASGPFEATVGVPAVLRVLVVLSPIAVETELKGEGGLPDLAVPSGEGDVMPPRDDTAVDEPLPPLFLPLMLLLLLRLLLRLLLLPVLPVPPPLVPLDEAEMILEVPLP